MTRQLIAVVLVSAIFSPMLFATDAHFKKTKIIIPKGDDTDDLDCDLVFTDAKTIVVKDRKTDEVFRSIPFAALKSMTYERAKSPRAKTAIFLSPLALFSPGKKHWLTIEYTKADGSGNDYVLLRLDKNEQQRILAEATSRTGMEVERIVES